MLNAHDEESSVGDGELGRVRGKFGQRKKPKLIEPCPTREPLAKAELRNLLFRIGCPRGSTGYKAALREGAYEDGTP